ncbi:4-phosphoerythronate dehydrogenase [Porticoccus sp. W117]|uniref:4-phosphoerythronate dehydrogenase n=1 Tax=Porticoccus sp. W117 TaxID=3054777 RepID=UPI002595E2EE|nr:4-phosphoerythronate dehydrogenase [Porticoccus sp. W117]MDM3872624.1 4-phosphoerythronate dehydrogenase [Porticoccus sp. W117]
MKILADENMPLVRELFAPYGEVTTVPGRNLRPEDVAQADALLVRSITQVNRQLLDGSAVRFVGSATIGVDHIDLDYLQQRNITFSAAPGCNANAVVDYVCVALCSLRLDWQQLCASQKIVGIIGCGNVGGRLYRRLKKLGASVRCYDPFLDAEQNSDLTSLEAVLGSDIVCLHTPHTRSGPFPTHHMLSTEQLAQLPQDAILINAGRGAAIDNQALLRLLEQRNDLRVVLDVWENEPGISLPLLQKVTLATPHIAGYSVQGKCNGTAMVRDAFLRWLGEPAVPETEQGGTMEVSASSIGDAVGQVYDVAADDRRMREQLTQPGAALAFDCLRKEYPPRHEFHRYRLTGQGLSEFDRRVLGVFGFLELSS